MGRILFMKNIKTIALLTALTASAVFTGCNASGSETTAASETVTEITSDAASETTATSAESETETTQAESSAKSDTETTVETTAEAKSGDSETSAQADAGSEPSASGYTDEQAFAAISFYVSENYASEGPDGEAPAYIETISNDGKEIVILYRSYTASQTYFHIDITTGETYITEIVPGIIDEETPNGVTFNIKDYIR